MTALQITSTVQPTLELERDKEKKWKLTAGEGKLDQDAINNLVIALTRLRAVRWVGPAAPEQGLDKPGVVITATLMKGAEKVTRKLSIGAKTNDLWAAAAEGKEGVFQIGAPDHDLLAGPLTDKAVVAPEANPIIGPGTGPSFLDTLKSNLPAGPPLPLKATPAPTTPAPATPAPATPAPAAPPQ